MTHVDTTAALPSLQDLLDPRNQADPYPLYSRWRAQSPLARLDDRLMVLTRYEDCAAVLRDGRFGHPEADDPRFAGRRPSLEVLVDDDGRPVRGFLGLNPPDHTRMRALVSQAFTRRRVERLAPRIEELTDELFTAMERAQGPVDLIEGLATPLPVAVISELLGVPAEDRHRMLTWSHAVARALVPDFLLPPGAAEQEAQARREFTDYLRELVVERRRAPGDDLLSALVTVHDDGDVLTENELLATCTLLLIAGHETTVNLIGNGTLALLRHPDQLARLRSDPALTENAVEELLRYDSPVQLTVRFALQDAEVAGVPVPAGSTLLLLIGAANRDPAAYEQPERLDIGRTPLRHLAFGQGIHFCLGAPLARLETQIALRILLARAPQLRLAGEPEWKDHITLRGLSRLPLSLG
ncbi:cytochrome P450 [Streptomyces sp. 2333.5]|uniref:cytochrome P450 n=1 Tax=unclassified Streptomyces TaxID=2593676 RepID=UPI00089A9D86|nr:MULTISPECIES: cytochrome P450 [unclassified Streptomyces]PJJ06322.1 cytochrome P450 [Streptomyces sp. 2333.5]SEE93778.1 Cytochrome P450 [Streptomyces sp. 2314.4]SEF08834.1 Cytochrome P450 [Streptomyces sp. 2112.2]